jgi:predicted O-methyltransferase YrrM
MYSRLQLAKKYFTYFITASNGKGHGIHSPFVFDFITKVLNDKNNYPGYTRVENLRKQLLLDKKILTVQDFGAGSAVSKTTQRSVSSIAQNAAKPKKFGQLLYRMIKYYQPGKIVELGTSLGITTSYLSFAKPDAQLMTLEGAPEIAAIARENFKKMHLKNITLTEGNFDDTLPNVTSSLSSIDLCFVDGNHRREPTERYFEQLLSKIENDSILVFDDIHWSSEMEAAWQTIQKHPAVRCSIDLFFIGIILFRKEFREKQHFVIRF